MALLSPEPLSLKHVQLEHIQLVPMLLGLSVALGIGLLIGLERERRKGVGPRRGAAGIRSFTLVALAGALAQGLAQPLLVALGGLAVVVLAGLAYAYSLGLWAGGAPKDDAQDPQRPHNPLKPPTPSDPGMTTELALVVTYMVGVLAMAQPALGAGVGAAVAALLAARGRLHHFATQLLTEQELHDGLLLAALALVLIPLVPQQPVAWLAGVQPRQLAALVLLILVLQAAGHVALRLLGPRAGLAASGLMSGFVSSTATVAAMGAHARAYPEQAAAATAGAMMSTAATWLQALLMLLALAPALAGRLSAALVSGAVVALVVGLWQARQAQDLASPTDEGAPASSGRALRVREAVVVASLLTGVTVVVSAASRWLGDGGALLSAGLAALGDAHSGIAALGALQASDRLAAATAGFGVLISMASNSVSRTVVAAVSGGRAYALRVAGCLVSSLAMALLVAWLTGALTGAFADALTGATAG